MSTSFKRPLNTLSLCIMMALAAVTVAAPAQPLKRQCNASASNPQAPIDNVGSIFGGTGIFTPRFSTYMDVGPWNATAFPTPDDLGDWNDFLLSFWMASPPTPPGAAPGPGPFDMALSWASFADADRKRIAGAYRAANKTLRVSMFGASDQAVVGKFKPEELGASVAQFVKDNYLHGVDVDFEESPAFESAGGGGEDFLVQLTKTLRAALPATEGYVLSHAPQAPYFTTASGMYPNGAYRTVHREVGDLIDFYNVQFYNQGDKLYEDCPTLITSPSGPAALPGTSVAGILASTGMRPAQLVLGKPATAKDASNGFMDPKALGDCIRSAGKGSVGGVMSWQWTPATKEDMKKFIQEARGNL